MLFRIFKTFRDITANGTTLQARINDNLIFTSSDSSIIINLSEIVNGKQINLRAAASGPAAYGFGKVKGVDGADIAQADQLQDQLLVKSTGGSINCIASDVDDSVDLNVINNTSIQKIEVTDGIVTSIRKRINFIAGNGVTINVADDNVNDRANITINGPNGFGVVTDGVNSAVADSANDTLRLKSLDGSVTITASDVDDSVNLGVNVFNFGKVSDGTNIAVADALEDTLLVRSSDDTIIVTASDSDDSIDLRVRPVNLIAGENISKGDPCYIDNVTGKAFKAQANNINKMPVVVVAMDNVSIDTIGAFIGYGRITGLTFSAADVGKLLYVNSTGGLTTTRPSISSNIVQKVGVVKSTTEMIVDVDDYQRVKIQDTATLLALDQLAFFKTPSTTFVLVTQVNLNLDSYRVLGATRLFRFEVFAWNKDVGSTSEVRLYDSTNDQIIGTIIITTNTPTKYILDVTSSMPSSGEITLDLQARKASGTGEARLNQAQLEISISN